MLTLPHLSTALLLGGSLLAALVVILLLMRPVAGLMLLLALTPVETVLGLPFEYSKAAKLILTGLTAGVYFLTYAGRPGPLPQYPYLWAQLLFISSGIAATLASAGPADSALGVLQLVVVFSLSYLIALSPLRQDTTVTFLRLLVYTAAIVAPLALIQMFAGYGGFLGSVEQQVDADNGIYAFGNGLFRSAATFNGSNSAAAFFGGAFLVAVMHATVYRVTRNRYIGLSVLLGLALISTFSRGAFLGTVTAVSLLFPVKRPILKWTIILSVLTSIVVTFALFPPESLRFLLRPGQGTLSRIVAWEEAVVIFRDHWLTGIGIYGFKPYVELNWPDPNVPRQPHNGLLKAVVEQGVTGGLAYILFAVAFARTCFESLRGELRGSERWFIMAGIAGMGTCFFLQELFDAGFVAGGSSIAVVLGILIGAQCRHLQPWVPLHVRRRVPLLSRAVRHTPLRA